MRLANSFVLASLFLVPVLTMGQGGPLNPSDLLKPLGIPGQPTMAITPAAASVR